MASSKITRIGRRQDAILYYVANHPGATSAEIDRATNHHVPHSHTVTYDAVNRLLRRGLLERAGVGSNGGRALRVTECDASDSDIARMAELESRLKSQETF